MMTRHDIILLTIIPLIFISGCTSNESEKNHLDDNLIIYEAGLQLDVKRYDLHHENQYLKGDSQDFVFQIREANVKTLIITINFTTTAPNGNVEFTVHPANDEVVYTVENGVDHSESPNMAYCYVRMNAVDEFSNWTIPARSLEEAEEIAKERFTYTDSIGDWKIIASFTGPPLTYQIDSVSTADIRYTIEVGPVEN